MSSIRTTETKKLFLKELGYELVDDAFINSINKIAIKDKYGFMYFTSINYLQQGRSPLIVDISNPFSIDNIKLWLYINKKEFILLSKSYKNAKSYLLLKDNKGYYYNTTWDNLQNSKNLLKFNKLNPYTIQNIKLWLILNNKPFELISDEYNGATAYLKWECLNKDCEEIWEASWNSIKSGSGCPYCCHNPQKVGWANCLATKRPDLIFEWHRTKNNNLTPWDITPNYSKKVWWKCNDCDHEWEATPNNRNSKGCPECSKSKGEKRIKKYLDSIFIVYERNKEFDGLIGLGNGLLSYDFYLPQYNLLIEYQGEQHEKPVKFKRKRKINRTPKEEFEIQQEHDKRKCEFAKNHNIKLLEIWYWDFENIEQILEKEVII